jgi:hypothetical protein
MASGQQSAPRKQAEHMAAPTSDASPSKYPLPTGSRPHWLEGELAPIHIDFRCSPSIRPPRDGVGFSLDLLLLFPSFGRDALRLLTGKDDPERMFEIGRLTQKRRLRNIGK